MVHGAIYDAVNAIAGTPYQPYLVAPRANRHASTDAAVATTAYQVLLALFPDQENRLRARYDDSLAAIPDGPRKRSGISVGRQAAAAMVAARQNDGSFGDQAWVVGTQPGQWRPTPPTFAADGAWVAHVKPFLIPSVSPFLTSGPPALTSAAYARDLNEVKAVGAANSTVRTPDQTDAAIWWHDRHLTEWEIKRQLAAGQHLDVLQAARMFAMVDLAQADSAIVCFAEKATWSFWRPVTALQLADTDGNPATIADPAWMPLLITPPFPDYTSGHACATGAPCRRSGPSSTATTSPSARSARRPGRPDTSRASHRRSPRSSMRGSGAGSTSARPISTARGSERRWPTSWPSRPSGQSTGTVVSAQIVDRTAWCAQPADSRRLAGAYGRYCSAIFTTWSWRTVIQNTPPPPRGSTIASLSSGTRTFLVALPV
jgi:hypothetical protein